MKNKSKISTLLTALIFLISLTACKTTEYVYVYPEVIEQTIPDVPTHEPWNFKPVDGGQFLSEKDAQEVGTYILSLKKYSEELLEKLNYYIETVRSWQK